MTANTSLSQEIAVALRTDILQQRYLPAERLPSERDLAERFGASRGAVREALSQLEQLGLIVVQPGGARVQPLREARIAVLGPLMELGEMPDPRLVDQFLQTFGALAVQNAREAAVLASVAQLDQLHAMIATLRRSRGDFEAAQPAWIGFLEALAEIADNLVVRLIGNDLKAQFVDHMLKLGIKPSLRKRVVGEVLQSLEQAFSSGDRELAGTAMACYFDELRMSVAQAMERRLAS